MELKDLKIGNIVLDSSGNYYAIEEIKRDNENIIHKKGEYRLLTRTLGFKNLTTYEDLIESFNPVLLTEEILLKCGFEIEKGYAYNLAKSGDIKIYFGENFFYNSTPIKHLHQLQNLYWCLCGEELKIE